LDLASIEKIACILRTAALPEAAGICAQKFQLHPKLVKIKKT